MELSLCSLRMTGLPRWWSAIWVCSRSSINAQLRCLKCSVAYHRGIHIMHVDAAQRARCSGSHAADRLLFWNVNLRSVPAGALGQVHQTHTFSPHLVMTSQIQFNTRLHLP